MSPLPILLSLLLSLLPLSVHSQIPTVDATAVLASDGNSITYLARLALNTTPVFDSAIDSRFAMDTNAQVVSFSNTSCPAASKLGISTLVTGNTGIVAAMFDSFVANIPILCRKNSRSIAALGSKNTALPAQISRSLGLPLRFAYTLRDTSASIFFGKTAWIQYTQIVPPVTVPVEFMQIPLKLDGAASYMVKMTGIGIKAFLTGQEDNVEISVTQRFTTLPPKIYGFVVAQFQQEASERKIKRASTSAYNGKLGLCYQMRSSDVTRFRNVTMVFSSKFRWSVPADKYLVPKPGTSNVFCLAYLELAAGNGSHGVIGTLQQEDRAMEFNLERKSLGVSSPLIGALISP
ncbi:hypothetical protein SELMODRAFT_420972 [Selaginella moellendorffii]|uniref:Xylanase inhibitor C-terminal domain-containing protein n=1 Tax=Selaginella moellendorffii TaxID=88036 RepID=D8SDQ6_SELML|nr:hypothetical protein SELMODRAFT_420972 [Selaginella moellendorffii]